MQGGLSLPQGPDSGKEAGRAERPGLGGQKIGGAGMGCKPRLLNNAMDRGIWAAEVTRINLSPPIILAIILASSAVSQESLSNLMS